MPIGVNEVDKLVRAVRASIILTDHLPTFDIADARKLYDVTLGTVAARRCKASTGWSSPRPARCWRCRSRS